MIFTLVFHFFLYKKQLQQQQSTQNSQSNVQRKENDWNMSDNSNHSQIAISTQKGDFLVEQIKNVAGGEQSTYFLSPINSSNKGLPTMRRGSDASVDLIGIYNFFISFKFNLTRISFIVKLKSYLNISDENVIGLSLQEILPDNNNFTAGKMLVANPPNILKRAKSLKMQNSVSIKLNILFFSYYCYLLILRHQCKYNIDIYVYIMPDSSSISITLPCYLEVFLKAFG